MDKQIIPHQKMVDFIKAQPRERVYNFADNSTGCAVGCPMVHFGKEVLGLEEFYVGIRQFKIGINPINVLAELDSGIYELVPLRGYILHTYGELQDELRRRGM